MRLELLQIPERRNSILPELLRFFEETGGDQWRQQFEKFLRHFTGSQFVVPDTHALEEIARDEVIVRALHNDTSIQGRIALLRNYKITHQYLDNLWRACEGRSLEPPPNRGQEDAIEQAVFWVDKYPSVINDMVCMFNLSAKDRARITAKVTARKRKHVAKR